MKTVNALKEDFYSTLEELEFHKENGIPAVATSIFLHHKLIVLSEVLAEDIPIEDRERVEELTSWDEFENMEQKM